MTLAAFLEQSRAQLTARWTEAANAVYPFATAGFLRTRNDPFANPVGTRSRELSDILLSAVTGLPHEGHALRAALEEFVRVRAIQEMPAETSLAVMFAYKSIIRAYIQERSFTLSEADEAKLRAMDERCDTLALLAFGIYINAREALFTARLEDMRRRHSQVTRLIQRHGLAVEAETAETENGAPL